MRVTLARGTPIIPQGLGPIPSTRVKRALQHDSQNKLTRTWMVEQNKSEIEKRHPGWELECVRDTQSHQPACSGTGTRGLNDPMGKQNVPLSLQFGAWIGICAKAWTSKELCSRQKELEKSHPSDWTSSRQFVFFPELWVKKKFSESPKRKVS